MKISKSILSKICTVAGFLVLAQFSFAMDVIIRKDNTPPPPDPQSNTMQTETDIPVTATIDATTLSIYFEGSVGVTTITVYDELNNVVHQQVVDTAVSQSVFIGSNSWNAGNYTVKIQYGTTHLIGDFLTE